MEAQGEPIQIKKYGTSVFSSRNAIEVCPKKMETEIYPETFVCRK